MVSPLTGDEKAVVRHVFDGTPLALEVAKRLQERGQRITEEIRRQWAHGLWALDLDWSQRASIPNPLLSVTSFATRSMS